MKDKKKKKEKKSKSSVDSKKQTSIIFHKCVLTLLWTNSIHPLNIFFHIPIIISF